MWEFSMFLMCCNKFYSAEYTSIKRFTREFIGPRLLLPIIFVFQIFQDTNICSWFWSRVRKMVAGFATELAGFRYAEELSLYLISHLDFVVFVLWLYWSSLQDIVHNHVILLCSTVATCMCWKHRNAWITCSSTVFIHFTAVCKRVTLWRNTIKR